MSSLILTFVRNCCNHDIGMLNKGQLPVTLDGQPNASIHFKVPAALLKVALVIMGKAVKVQARKTTASNERGLHS